MTNERILPHLKSPVRHAGWWRWSIPAERTIKSRPWLMQMRDEGLVKFDIQKGLGHAREVTRPVQTQVLAGYEPLHSAPASTSTT
jgi:hypothetical protein